MPYGSLYIDDPRRFDEFPRGDDELSQALDFLRLQAGQPLIRPPVHDWPQITDCVRRGAGYALDATAHAFHASLRFDPADAQLGGYEIRFHGQQPEAGAVLEVVSVEDAELWRHEYRSLRSFPTRYAVTTAGPHGKRVWLIGITGIRELLADDIASNA